jgi:acetyl esterase
MTLNDYRYDPELAAALPLIPQIDASEVLATRAQFAEFYAATSAPDSTGVQISERLVARPSGTELRLRLYQPKRRTASGCVYDVHGGGFMFGDLENNHARNVKLSRDLGVLVVAVDYRLAPEHPFPAPLDDCRLGLKWIAAHAADLEIDPTRIVLHGTSAGGGLCAALALHIRDHGGPAICYQYLGIPELDDRMNTASMQAFVTTPGWNRPNAVVSWDAYLGRGIAGTGNVSPYAAPARAGDLSGLPPTYISVMEFDPLRDEGIDYATRLLRAGVSVELHLFPGTFHGSFRVENAEVSQRELSEEISVLGRALGLPIPPQGGLDLVIPPAQIRASVR